LLDRCVAYAKAHKHRELTDRTIWQAFEAERPQLVPNKYSVASRAVGRPIEIQAYADRIVRPLQGLALAGQPGAHAA
jgi:hypothetical protein